MRLLHLAWPHLPLRLERAARPNTPELVVIGGKPWEAGTVLDCSPAARQQGIRPGMPLGKAHPLAPEALFLVPDLVAYRAAAEAALDALSAFAPFVEGSTAPADPEFGRFFLGIEGLDRLWGDEPRLVGRIAAAVAPLLPGSPRAGIGGSRFASGVAAVVAREQLPATDIPWHAVPPGGEEVEAAFLAPLPVTLLPAERAALERLRLFGLRRIGDLARLPRSAVVARFGGEGGFLHDLANGRDGRPIVPYRPPERLRAHAELDPPVELLEPLRFVLHRLADLLCTQLGARGTGATSVRLELALEGGGAAPAFVVEQPLPGPTASPEAIERLLTSRLETAPPSRPVMRMTLELDGVRSVTGPQLGLFAPQTAREGRLDWQLADLAIRFGGDRILWTGIPDPDARLPEERVTWIAAAGPPAAGSSADVPAAAALIRGQAGGPPAHRAPAGGSRVAGKPADRSHPDSVPAVEPWGRTGMASGYAPGRGRG